jgi:hypothetical protein
MHKNRMLLVAFAATLGAAAWTVSVGAQRIVTGLPMSMPNLATAQVVEIKDSSDAVALKGTFVTSSDTAKEVERTAMLVASGTGTTATGKAEVELARAGNAMTSQEIEVGLKGLPAKASFTLNVTTNRKGGAELKLTSKLPPGQTQ